MAKNYEVDVVWPNNIHVCINVWLPKIGRLGIIGNRVCVLVQRLDSNVFGNFLAISFDKKGSKGLMYDNFVPEGTFY